MRIKLKITGRSYDLSLTVPRVLELSQGAQVDDALAELARLNITLAPSALLAISGQHIGSVAHHEQRTIEENDELLVFAPVAGG